MIDVRCHTRVNVSRGFTLIEALLVLSVLAICLAWGVPSLRELRHRTLLSLEVARFVDAVQVARTEAVMRNVPVSVCPSPMAATGQRHCAGTYDDGWIVFANPNRDGEFNPEDEQVLRVYGAVPRGFSITERSGERAASELINYLPDGSSRRNRTLLFCPPQDSLVPSASLVFNIIGRVRQARGESGCPRV